MCGGSDEYTAAYVNNGNNSFNAYALSLLNAAAKYKDIYTVNGDTWVGDNYVPTVNKKGDAIYETSLNGNGLTSWYGEASYIPYSFNPIFVRSGYYSGTNTSGIFSFNMGSGGASNGRGFRPVIVVDSTF